MVMAHPAELREKQTAELAELATTLRAEVFNARFQKYAEQLEKTSTLREKRRELARVLTILRERELGSEDA
jgi:large subunit ribosomal protein L29